MTSLQLLRAAQLLAVSIVAVGLFWLGAVIGAQLAPAPPIPFFQARPAVHTALPEALDPAANAMVSSAADGMKNQSRAKGPLSITPTDQLPSSAGGSSSEAQKERVPVSAGGLAGGVVWNR